MAKRRTARQRDGKRNRERNDVTKAKERMD